MQNNNFTGSLPSEWGGVGWQSLQIMSLFNNSLDGSIPATWTRNTFPAMQSVNNGM